MKRPFLSSAVLALGALLGAGQLAHAETPPADAPVRHAPDLIVLGAGFRPEYEGADTVSAVPVLALRLNRGRRYLALEGPALFANLIDRPALEAGPYLEYAFGRGGDVDSEAVSAFEEIDATVELGAFVALTRAVPALGSALRLQATATADAGGVHEDWKASLDAELERELSPRAAVAVGASLGAAGDGYADTWFSVSERDAAAGSLPTFDAEGGPLDGGLGLSGRYALSPRMSLTAFASWRRLLGDAAGSPVVVEEGDRDQFAGGAGVAWTF